MNEVVSFRITRRPQAGRCNYCGRVTDPPLSYWYALYAYLAGWSR